MAAVVVVNDGFGRTVKAHCINQLNKSKLSLYKLLHFKIPFKQLYTSNKMERFIYNGGCGVHGLTLIKRFKRRASL